MLYMYNVYMYVFTCTLYSDLHNSNLMHIHVHVCTCISVVLFMFMTMQNNVCILLFLLFSCCVLALKVSRIMATLSISA